MRLNFEFPEERINELKELQSEAGLDTMKDLINNALTIFEWAVHETRNGNEIAAVNEDDESYRILVTPALQKIAKERAVRQEAHSRAARV
jgi:hypothetical protein